METTAIAQGPVDVDVSRMPEFTPTDYDPFNGDFGAPGDMIFSDGMVKARKQHKCSHCGGEIVVGEVHRSRYEKADGEMMKHRWCAECCAAMVLELEAESAEDEPEYSFPFERRHHLNAANARSEAAALAQVASTEELGRDFKRREI